MATLVVVTMSLPQTLFGDGKFSIARGRHDPNDPFRRCVRPVAAHYPEDIRLPSVERDSQSLEPRAALDPPSRQPGSLPCGSMYPGQQSNTFQFPVNRNLVLFWTVQGVPPADQFLRIMNVVPHGQARTVAKVRASNDYCKLTPVVGARYYIVLEAAGGHLDLMKWAFDY
ncbi:hypothetical protein MMC07_009435, partial [Pseudocyphellaria aurata]|nr:hypothetical protein [Pseudocyphellaria aurata]